jgi:hypothetical protein
LEYLGITFSFTIDVSLHLFHHSIFSSSLSLFTVLGSFPVSSNHHGSFAAALGEMGIVTAQPKPIGAIKRQWINLS